MGRMRCWHSSLVEVAFFVVTARTSGLGRVEGSGFSLGFQGWGFKV